jgi:hypothetical protein
MNRLRSRATWARSTLLLAVGLILLAGCSKELPPAPKQNQTSASNQRGLSGSPEAGAGLGIESNGTTPPAGLVPVSVGGKTITIWPYTGASFNGVPWDPINLIFVGHADPIEIRAALLSLDGDRTALGFPPVYPFNARWSDCAGDVQTAYADGRGWIGSVIQLQLGSYGPVRVHLRLFRASDGSDDEGECTLGGAHFEVVIPGTTEHQVLSWELAQQLVTVDLIRSGLLAAGGPALSGSINQAPSFREIPDFIYNQLPPELTEAIGGPAQPVSGAVPIASDGMASILQLENAPALAAGTFNERFTIEFGQVIPKPFCSAGPLDWVYVTGPVQFDKTATVDGLGNYQYVAEASGRLTVTPVDITTNPPTPVGTPFTARVRDQQEGFLTPRSEAVSASARRITREADGSEMLLTILKVASPGADHYKAITRCLEPEP